MRVAFGIDGTISERPTFFALLSATLRAAGHYVLILTYRDPDRRQQTESQLADWNIEYDEMVFAESIKTNASRTSPTHYWSSNCGTGATSISRLIVGSVPLFV